MDIRPTTGRMRVGALDLRVTGWGVVLVVFEPVEVLVAFPAGVAAVWLVFFHAEGTGIRVQGFGVHDREGAILVVL